MRNKRLARFLVVFGLLTLSVSLSAHHGNAAYDTEKTVTVKGTVTEWNWINPHCMMKFDVTDDKGNVQHWLVEASNPPDMVRHGWARNSFKAGDEVTVTLMPAKNGLPIGRFKGERSVVLSDGKVFSAVDPVEPVAPGSAKP